ncbi:OLC1v1004729C5 [Oldenlandia corymbosa var. corymbosa]|uniref:methenyltetrahydrofolate cyclohydrolase n=1 Tax=Oldenlandia corymbosa var. corymbosa TaxID=529605 RepID=A0AAV1DFD6_OLDCO|nr:OLC1v1004729C5 [Oldenlandia corymbosa var. corymbosa]
MRIALAVGWWRIARAKIAHTKFVRNLICRPLLSVDSPDIWKINPGSSSHFSSHPSSNFSASNEKIGVVLDGKLIANDLKSRIAGEVNEMKKAIGKTPGLGIVLVGERRDSHTFIRTKVKACNEVGIVSVVAELPNNSKEGDICDAVSRFNDNPSVHGIIVQLPLPKHLDEEKIMNVVSVEKDVDGFHPLNMGNLAIAGREPLFIPCAPKACLELLLRYGMDLRGKKAAVVGRSKIVGLPTSLLLQRHQATVSLVHAFTGNPEKVTCQADIVVSDVGTPNTIRGHWLKPGAVVIDTGTSSVEVDAGSFQCLFLVRNEHCSFIFVPSFFLIRSYQTLNPPALHLIWLFILLLGS